MEKEALKRELTVLNSVLNAYSNDVKALLLDRGRLEIEVNAMGEKLAAVTKELEAMKAKAERKKETVDPPADGP